jgi:transposase
MIGRPGRKRHTWEPGRLHGIGLSLYAKRLDRGRFVWPQTVDGVVSLTTGQMSYLLEAIDWRNPQHTWRPQAAG